MNETDMNRRLPAKADFEAQDAQGDEIEIDLLELFFRLIESWKIICATAIAGAIVMGVVIFFFITPQYEATSKLYILNSNDSAINLSDLQIGAYLTKDYK